MTNTVVYEYLHCLSNSRYFVVYWFLVNVLKLSWIDLVLVFVYHSLFLYAIVLPIDAHNNAEIILSLTLTDVSNGIFTLFYESIALPINRIAQINAFSL